MSTRESRRMRLLEISRGAQKLTQMVCSLFKARNFDGLVKDASSVTASAKKKLELETGRRINRGVARSRRLGAEEGEQFGSCSWRSCIHEEEVKKVIRESLLLNSYDDEKASSSRSLGSYLRSDEFSSSYREAEEAIRIKNSRPPQSKTATPNLIARLMGLEELPAREPAANSHETKPKRCDNAPERVTLRSIIEREKVSDALANGHRDKRLETDREAEFCSRAMEVTTTWRGGEEKEGLKAPMRILLMLEDEERLKEVGILKKKKEDKVELPSRMSRMHVSADCKQKLKMVDGRQSSDILSTHHRSRKVSAAPLPQAMTSAAISAEPPRRPAATASAMRSMESERSLAVNNSTNPAKKTTGVTRAQKVVE